VLLNSRYQLHDIGDVEALCARAARGWAAKTEARLSSEDFESLVSFLIVSVWRMSVTYDPELSTSFEAIVRGRLSNRCVDWFRTHAGRTRWQFSGHTYEREVQTTVSLDAPTGDDGAGLAESVGAVDRDLEAVSRADSFGGLLAGRRSEEDWDLALCRSLSRRLLRERNQRARAA
jgi:hypothetical protein